MRRIFLIAAALLLTSYLGPIPVHAASVRIGVIDTARILQQADAAKAARETFQEEVGARRATLARKQGDIRELERRLKEDRDSLPPAARKELQETFEQSLKEFRRLQADLEEELKKKNAELLRGIVEEVREVVRAYREQKKLTLILESRFAVDYDPAVDITDEIIEAYDKRKK